MGSPVHLYQITSSISVLMGIAQLFINLKCKPRAVKLIIPAILMVPTIWVLMLYFGVFGRAGGDLHQLAAMIYAIAVAILWLADTIAWIVYFLIKKFG